MKILSPDDFSLSPTSPPKRHVARYLLPLAVWLWLLGIYLRFTYLFFHGWLQR